MRKFFSQGGYSLLELIITLAVLAILVMGTVPMAQNAVKRDKEMKLREALRMMRSAIDEFKRDTYGACPQGAITSNNPTLPNQQQNAPLDPRSRVVIDDCKIFDSENLDRYPPSLDQLVQGVRVRARGAKMISGSGLRDDTQQATEINQDKEITKVYLRELPVDPMTGEKDWKFRSSYQDKDSDNWDEVNVFDVRSNSKDVALNGEKYSDW
jgi:general secretion pathway protein G